uniref:Uncharacterized protein n=1 Tax=Timema shepardi TaxID=629360 RepID=A0A7R9G541_TIMSH|nr:unnamed protein product [Timema shepardi]
MRTLVQVDSVPGLNYPSSLLRALERRQRRQSIRQAPRRVQFKMAAECYRLAAGSSGGATVSLGRGGKGASRPTRPICAAIMLINLVKDSVLQCFCHTCRAPLPPSVYRRSAPTKKIKTKPRSKQPKKVKFISAINLSSFKGWVILSQGWGRGGGKKVRGDVTRRHSRRRGAASGSIIYSTRIAGQFLVTSLPWDPDNMCQGVVKDGQSLVLTTEIRCQEKSKGGLAYEVILADPVTVTPPKRPSSPSNKNVSVENIEEKLKAAEERRLDASSKDRVNRGQMLVRHLYYIASVYQD